MHAIGKALHNAQSAQHLLFGVVVAAPLFNIAHLAFLKYHQTDDPQWKERAIFSFCNKLVITARVVSLIFFALIPISLYLGLTQGLETLKNRSLVNLLKTIRDLSGPVGFFVPLTKLLFQITPRSIAEELYLHFHNFKMPKEYQETSLIENLQITPEILTALKLPADPKDDVVLLALASKKLATSDDLKEHKITDSLSLIAYLNRFKSKGPSPALSRIKEHKISTPSLVQYLQLPKECTDEDLITEALSSKGLTSLKDLQNREILTDSHLSEEKLELYLNIFKLEYNVTKSPAYDLLLDIAFTADDWTKIYQALDCKPSPEAVLESLKKKGLRTIQDLFDFKILTFSSKNNSPKYILKQLLNTLSKGTQDYRLAALIHLVFGLKCLYENSTITSMGIVCSFILKQQDFCSKIEPLSQIVGLSASRIFKAVAWPLIQRFSLPRLEPLVFFVLRLQLQIRISRVMSRVSLYFSNYSRAMSQWIDICQHFYEASSEAMLLHCKTDDFLMGLKIGLALKYLLEPRQYEETDSDVESVSDSDDSDL